MPVDLRDALKDAAPEPRFVFDEARVAKRAHTLGLTRLAVASGLLLVAISGILFAGSFAGTRSEDGVANHGNKAPRFPKGPRYEVMSGRYGDDWNTDPGKEWRLLVWGKGHTQCWQLATEGAPSNHSGTCSAPSGKDFEQDAFAGNLSFFTESDDPDEYWFVAGAVSEEVATIEFRPRDGETVVIEPRDPPEEAGLELRYYAATLPLFDYAEMFALDSDDEVLQRQNICSPTCQEDRKREDQAKVAEYEQAPVALIDRAAAFANMAVGFADLLNPFATNYGFERIEARGETFLAEFEVSRCEPPRGPHGQSSCEKPDVPGSVTVGIQGRRFVVREASGPMTDSQRNRLFSIAYEADERAYGPVWKQIADVVVREQHRENLAVAYSLVWMGNIPPPVSDYGSWCSWQVIDDEGNVVHDGNAWPAEVRAQYRVSDITAGLDNSVKDADHVNVNCDDPRGDFLRDRPQ